MPVHTMLSHSTLLIAEVSRWESLGGGLRAKGPASSPLEILLIVGACIAIGVAAWYLLSRFTDIGRTRVRSPRKLFAELCVAHNLDAPSRRLLAKVARWQRLKHPARLFLEPERFEAVNLSGELRASQEQLCLIRSKLFATPEAAVGGETLGEASD